MADRDCIVQFVNGTIYLLEGEAYQAYLDFNNIALPLHTMKLESQLLPSDIPYLINVYGPTEPVQSLVTEYNITRSSVKVNRDGSHTTFYGWIYKQNLDRFLDENPVDSLKARSIYVDPIGGYSDENGTGDRVPFPIPDNLAEVHHAFREAKYSRILTEKTGVTRISEYDLLPID